MKQNCKSEIVSTPFDAEGFFRALDGQRIARDLTWKKVAEESKVSASTLTRISQGKRPDVDTLAALCKWAGIKADDFISGNHTGNAEPLANILANLRADKNLSSEGAKAIEAMVLSAYETFRKR